MWIEHGACREGLREALAHLENKMLFSCCTAAVKAILCNAAKGDAEKLR